jgi:glycosyltransferase involved in cell wall biosynthesis
VPTDHPAVAIAHDYLTQRGGAERVVLNLMAAFPDAPLYTSLYEARSTYDRFALAEVHTTALNRVPLLRHHHRLGLPFYASAMERVVIDADVTICSSSGWAHGVTTTGAKVVYCHAPARWIYQSDRYLGESRFSVRALADLALKPALRRWDLRAAATATRYLCNSTATAAMIAEAYGITATVIPPPPALTPGGEERPVPGIEPGFLLSVARLLPYKNVDVAIAAAKASGKRLVVVGSGPERQRLEAIAGTGTGITFLDVADDATLRWCYRNAAALLALSYEDYGLTPLEAASFATPSVALRAGGYLDTIVHGRTGILLDALSVEAVVGAVSSGALDDLDSEVITSHAASFSAQRFTDAMHEVVTDVLRQR